MTIEKPELVPPGGPNAPVGTSAAPPGRRGRLYGALSWIGVVLLFGFFATLVALEFHLI